MRAYKLHRPPLGRDPNHNTAASKLRRQLRRRDPNHNQKKEGGSLSSHPNTASSLANNGRTHSIGGAALAWRTGPRSAYKRPIEGRAQQRTSAEQSIRLHAPRPRRSWTDPLLTTFPQTPPPSFPYIWLRILPLSIHSSCGFVLLKGRLIVC